MTADKFTFRVATDRLYSPEGVWVLPEPDSTRVRVGLADYLQQHNGDVAFANVKPAGTKLAAGDQFAEIETIKAMVDLHAPISGTIVEVNAALQCRPGGHQPGTLRSGLAGGDRAERLGCGAVQAARSGGVFRGDASAGAGGFEGSMKPAKETVVVVPCSGIGKPFGSVSREAAYDLCEELRPESTRLVALAKLVLGEPGARELVAKHPAVTIDGCKQMCAAKMVRESGGTVAREVAVLDVFRRHKDLKPEGIAELNEAGRKLARVLAEEVAASLDGTGQTVKGAGHV